MPTTRAIAVLLLLATASAANCGDSVDQICVNNKGAYVMSFKICTMVSSDEICSLSTGSYDVAQTKCLTMDEIPRGSPGDVVYAKISVTAGYGMTCCSVVHNGGVSNTTAVPNQITATYDATGTTLDDHCSDPY